MSGVRTAADIYSNYDGGSAETQCGYVNFDRNDQFYGWNLGGVEQNQHLRRVYEQIGADRLNLSNTVGDGDSSVQNQSDSFNSRNCRRNNVGGEVDRIPNWQNFGGKMEIGTFQPNLSYKGGNLDARPHNHGGVCLENSRGGS